MSNRNLPSAELVQVAMEEWSTDSSDEAIANVCEQMATTPTERVRAYLDGADACLKASSCQAYVDCVMPLHEASFTAK